jgi:hypothetical protein
MEEKEGGRERWDVGYGLYRNTDFVVSIGVA